VLVRGLAMSLAIRLTIPKLTEWREMLEDELAKLQEAKP
jgi:hypothetical protein